MSVEILRKRFMPRFIGMERYSRTGAWAVVLSYIMQIAVLVGLGRYLLTLQVSFLNVVLMGLAALLIGTRFRGLNNIVHECSHASFTNDRRDNVILGSFCASIVMGCFKDYKDEHLSHHAHLGDYDRDMDLQGIKSLRIHEPLTKMAILRHLTNPFWGRHLPHYFALNLSSKDGAFFQWFKSALIVGFIAFSLIDPLTATLFVLIPYAFIYTTINYWTDCLDHAGIIGSSNELDASRNVLAPLPLRLLFFPRNDCYHLVHHLFPLIPARHLDAAHEQLCKDPIYQAKTMALHTVNRSETRLKTNIS